MTRFSRLLGSAVAASLVTSPVLAQRGAGGAGGAIGGIVGGVGGTLGRVGGTVGGTIGRVGNTVGGIGNTAGGVLGWGGLTGGRSSLLGGGGSFGTSTLRNYFTRSGQFESEPALNQVSPPNQIEAASPTEIENFREARLSAL